MAIPHIVRERRSHIREGELAGCSLTLIHSVCGGIVANLLQLDREPHTYCRTVTGPELVALARLNPDDGVPDAAFQLIADLTIAATALSSQWKGLVLARPDGQLLPNAILHGLSDRDLTELGRVASALVAAVEAGAR